MFEGSAANAAAADDADATFDDTALALEVATRLPATMAPEDCVMDAAEIPELVPAKLVVLLLVMVLVAGEAVLANPEAEDVVPNVFMALEAITEEPEAERLVLTVDPWVANVVANDRVSVKEEPLALIEDGVADGEPIERELDPMLVLEALPLLDDIRIVCRVLGVTLGAAEFDNDTEVELLVRAIIAEFDDKPGAVVKLKVWLDPMILVALETEVCPGAKACRTRN